MGLLIAEADQSPINPTTAVVAPGLHGVIDHQQQSLPQARPHGLKPGELVGVPLAGPALW